MDKEIIDIKEVVCFSMTDISLLRYNEEKEELLEKGYQHLGFKRKGVMLDNHYWVKYKD